MLAFVLLAIGSLLGAATGTARAAVPETARAAAAPDADNPRAELTLLLDVERARAGEPLRAGVLFELDRGWHVYWRNPGQSGLATQIEWRAADAEVGPLRWPAPEVFRESDGFITTYGYARSVLLASELTFAPATRGPREISAEVDFLVCEVRCIPGRATLRRTLEVGSEAVPAERRTRASFDEWSARVPQPPEALGIGLEALYSQEAIRPRDEFRAAIALLPCAAPEIDPARCPALTPAAAEPWATFVPERIRTLELQATGTRPHPFVRGAFLATLAGRASPDDPRGDQRLRGVVSLRVAGETRHVEVDLPLPRAAAGASVRALDNPWLEPLPAPQGAGSLARALGLGLLGGILLNLMPCVLPVLALKLFSLTELAHRSRREVNLHAAVYSGGILVAMAALALAVVELRALGASIGWGFQFQEPLYAAALGALLVAFATNLFGVWELAPDLTSVARVVDRASGLRRSFLEGLLAVALATPCSAPFLATAVGFAFAADAPEIFAVFLAIGVGLALPFALVASMPAWRRLVPRPGAWMKHLRALLGFALLATVAWLLWVVGRAGGSDAMAGLLAFLLLVALAAWLYGALQRAQRRLLGVLAGGLLLVAACGLLAFVPLAPEQAPAAPHHDGERAFDPAAIAAELARGRPVFVYFTADWCLTCKLNERVVFDDARTRRELARLDVATFRADWTRRDEAIRAELARFGRAGVPMYLVYSPDEPSRPQVLPELLTVELFVRALRGAAGERT